MILRLLLADICAVAAAADCFWCCLQLSVVSESLIDAKELHVLNIGYNQLQVRSIPAVDAVKCHQKHCSMHTLTKTNLLSIAGAPSLPGEAAEADAHLATNSTVYVDSLSLIRYGCLQPFVAINHVLLFLLQALPRCLVKLPKLSTLVASHNPIAELPGGISKLTGLLDLHMAHCALKAVPQVWFKGLHTHTLWLPCLM
jgi:Leucine-rich repeat (LRR) protein